MNHEDRQDREYNKCRKSPLKGRGVPWCSSCSWWFGELLLILFAFGACVLSAEAKPMAAERAQAKTQHYFHGFIFPTNRLMGDVLTLVPDAPVAVSFFLRGDDKRVKEPIIVVDVPKSVELFGAQDARTGPTRVSREDITVNACAYSRYVLRLARFYRRSDTNFAVLLQAKGPLPSGAALYWRLRDGNKAFLEKKVRLALVSPLPRGDLPKNFKVILFGGRVGNPNAYDRLAAAYKKTGVTGLMDYNNLSLYQALQKHGLNFYLKAHIRAGAYGWTDGHHPKVPELADAYAVKRDGTRSPNHFCPTHRLAHPEKYAPVTARYLKTLTDKRFPKAAGIVWDYEPWGIAICYCDRCRKAFSKFAKVPLEKVTRESLQSTYRKQWTDFRIRQNSDLVRLFKHDVHQVRPGLPIIICSDKILPPGQFQKRLERNAVDIRTFDADVDGHAPMMYMKRRRFYRLIDLTANGVKKPVIPTIPCFFLGSAREVKRPMYVKHSTPRELKMQMLAAATAGARGVTIFWGWALISDGLYIQSFSNALRTIGKVEDFLYKGERDDKAASVGFVPGQTFQEKYVLRRAHRLGPRILASVFQYHPSQDVFVRVRFPNLHPGRYHVVDPAHNKAHVATKRRKWWSASDLAEGVMLHAPSYQAQFLVTEPFKPGRVFGSEVTQQEVKQSFQHCVERQQARTKASRLPVSANGLRIRQADAKILMENAHQEVWLAPQQGGRILRWQIKKTGRELIRSSADNASDIGAAVDLFWSPKAISWCGEEVAAYQLASAKIEGGRASVTLKRALQTHPLRGLVLSKTFSIDAKSFSVNVGYALHNAKGGPKTFSFWSHNVPAGTPEEAALVLPAEGQTHVIADRGNIVYRVEGKPFTPDRAHWEKRTSRGHLHAGWAAVHWKRTRDALAASWDLKTVNQFYSYRQRNIISLEWMYPRVALKPGGTWTTRFRLIYLQGIAPKGIGDAL